jgi:hypothetical protein
LDVMEALPGRDDFLSPGNRSRPSGWMYINPENADASVPEEYGDRWVLDSVMSHPIERAAESKSSPQ